MHRVTSSKATKLCHEQMHTVTSRRQNFVTSKGTVTSRDQALSWVNAQGHLKATELYHEQAQRVTSSKATKLCHEQMYRVTSRRPNSVICTCTGSPQGDQALSWTYTQSHQAWRPNSVMSKRTVTSRRPKNLSWANAIFETSSHKHFLNWVRSTKSTPTQTRNKTYIHNRQTQILEVTRFKTALLTNGGRSQASGPLAEK